jgi:hypothetical protein
MNKDKTEARYYEKTDFSKIMRRQKGRHILPQAKRITINITERIYQEANELDAYMGMGYQNVLKAAMTLGIKDLYKRIQNHEAPKRKVSKRVKKAA